MVLNQASSCGHGILELFVFDVLYKSTLKPKTEDLLVEVELGPSLYDSKCTLGLFELSDEEAGSGAIATDDGPFGCLYSDWKKIFGIKAG